MHVYMNGYFVHSKALTTQHKDQFRKSQIPYEVTAQPPLLMDISNSGV